MYVLFCAHNILAESSVLKRKCMSSKRRGGGGGQLGRDWLHKLIKGDEPSNAYTVVG